MQRLHLNSKKTGGNIKVDKGIIIWMVFIGVIAVMLLVSRRIKSEINESGIETDAVVSRITDDGTLGDVDFDVYVRYRTEDGTEIEGVLSNPRDDLEEGQPVRIKYHPKYKNNARLM